MNPQLGQDTTPQGIPLPGHPIPYAYTPADIQNFIANYSTDPIVSGYLFTKQPPYGVIFNLPSGYGQVLLWFDASGTFHVIDVTNMSIASQVSKAPYESPDASVIDNMISQIENLIPTPQQALSAITLIALAIGVFVVWQLVREV
jgi:hypothetical protein